MKTADFLALTSILLTACTSKETPLFQGAEWIGTNEVVLNSSALPEFSLTYEVALNQPTSKAVFYFGGNDERLLTRNLNHMGVAHQRGEIYMALKLEGGCLEVVRRGYELANNEQTLQSFSLPTAWLTAPIHIRTEVEEGTMILSVNDSVMGNVKLSPNEVGGCDYIPYPMLGEIGCAGDATFKQIEVRNLRSPYTLYYGAEQLSPSSSDEAPQLFDPSQLGIPVLRSQLVLKDKPIESATLYATARGVYEVYLNGDKVGDDYFAPGCSQYNKTHYYQTYDIKAMLSKGNNQVTALLGEGWWMGPIGYWRRGYNHFGDQLALLAQFVIKYEDGEEMRFSTNARDWQVTTEGEIRYSSRFHGEVIDAAKEIALLPDEAWSLAQVMQLEGHLPTDSAANMPAVNDYSQFQLLPQPDESVKVRQMLTAQAVEEVRPGVFVYDMGQNMAGLPEITFRGMQPGQQVRMRYAEVKYPDMKGYAINKGMVMMENIRAANAQDFYYTRGGETETFAPHFTLHGYRFVEITGINQALPIADVKGRVLSSIELTSDFECSNPLVNRLWKNIQWSSLGNFISIPTDCPQRNERLGWGGDISVFSRTATYIADNYDFLRRHMRNIRDCQTINGMFPDIAPVNGGFGGFLWGSAGITVPYEIWRQTGRTEVLEEHFDAMARYMDFVKDNYFQPETDILYQSSGWGGLADWLNLEYNRIDGSALYECYYIFDLHCMAEMARALGRDSEADAYLQRADERKAFYLANYVDTETGKALYSDYVKDKKGELCDYQASYVLPLAFGLIDDETLRQKMTDNLVASIERKNSTDAGVTCPPFSLMTGFITTAWICKALSDNGRSDVAYRLFLNKSYPSWLYPVTQGATTIWERLNSYNDFEGFGTNNSMNSFNHYSFGAVGQWMMNRILGIERDPVAAGFKHFVLCPMPDPTLEMTYAKGYYKSAQGTIYAAWKREGDHWTYRFTIPAGCSATLLLPGQSAQEFTEGEHTACIR